MDRANGDPPIPSTGLTVVHNPEMPDLDVVFVHGFTGHPVRTWTHKKGDLSQQSHGDMGTLEPPSKIQKFGIFSKSQVRVSFYLNLECCDSLLVVAPKRVLCSGKLGAKEHPELNSSRGPTRSRHQKEFQEWKRKSLVSTLYSMNWDFVEQ